MKKIFASIGLANLATVIVASECSNALTPGWCANIGASIKGASDGDCKWLYSQCVPKSHEFKCGDFNDQKSNCLVHGCEYKFKTCVDVGTTFECNQFDGQKSFCQDNSCVYYKDQCHDAGFQPDCHDFDNSKATCEDHSDRCYYMAKSCMPLDETEDCNYWNGAPAFCKLRDHCASTRVAGEYVCADSECVALDGSKKWCNFNTNCRYIGHAKKCVSKKYHEPCSTYDSKKTCNNNSSHDHCQWFGLIGSCELKGYEVACHHFESKNDCNNTGRCTFYKGTCHDGADFKPPCSDFNGSKVFCRANADRCEWSRKTQLCNTRV